MALFYGKLFEPVVLTTAVQTLYTVPASQILRGAVVRFTNTTAGIVTVTAYAVPSGGGAGVGNALVIGRAVGVNDFFDLVIPTLKPSDFIQALASANTAITAQFLQGVLQA